MSLAVLPLPSSAAIGLTTTALILLVALALLLVAIGARRSSAREAQGGPTGAGREPGKPKPTAQEWPAAEEHFRTPLDQVENYAIILLDTEGRPTSWNTGIRRVLGYEQPEFLRTTTADLYPADARRSGAPAADLAEAARQGKVTVDRWLVRKNGSRFWGSVSTTAVHDRDGRLLGFARRLRDLSENKETEEQLRRKQDALELALDAAGLGTWEHDLSTGGVVLDPRARALFGIASDGPLTTAQWLETVHLDDREHTLQQWEKALGERAAYSAEYRVVWPDGSTHWLMAVGRFVTDPSTGSPLRFTGVVLDLTERRRTEEHLQESLRMEAVGRLAGGIAHDLNNMLAAILGFSDLLARSFEPGDVRAADLEQITRAATRSAGLTRQLLAFARREMIQPRALDLNTVIQHAQALLPPILGENVELELRLSPDLGVVYADARQIEQIVMNLVLNARDAMPQGGRVTIETSGVQLGPGARAWHGDEDRTRTGRFTMLSVTDTGHGMDAATLQRIWEPFFTTKPQGRGTGLGLASVYGAAKQSGGFVWADSEPGRGTTVQVYWPEIRAAVEAPAEPEPVPVHVGGSESVLIVEDEELVRALGVRALRSFGYTCHHARDASEALRLLNLQDTRVDLVVTDVVMPGMSGGALGEQLARLRPGMPVVYTSAFTDEDVIRRGMLGEGRPFLQKPFTPTELARVVRETLDAAARVVVVLLGLALAPRSGSGLLAQAASSPPAERVFSDSPGVFFEEYPTWANVSPDGRWAIYAGWTGVRVLDLRARQAAPGRIWRGVADVYAAAWGPRGSLLLYGSRDGKRGWYQNDPAGPRLLPLPRGASPVWSPDGKQVVYSARSAPDSIYAGPLGAPRGWSVAGRAINGLAWLPNGKALLVLAAQPQGTSNLVRVELPSGAQRVVAADLDATPVFRSPVAVSPDGRLAYVALASAGSPPPESRYVPRADRRLGIYGIDLATGARQLVVPPPAGGGDAMAPSVGGGTLYWTRTWTDASVVVMPAEGGPATLVVREAFMPSWRPDGRRIGVAYGDWRWADWAIDWDAGAVDVDEQGRATGPLRPVVTGYHEDFQPVWSPRGRWVAYHSHRPRSGSAPYYDAPDATDDIWLRADGAPARDSTEIRLTDFGWETGPPDWSRDGSRLVFTSYDRAGPPGVNQPFVVTIDTATGRPRSHGRLPLPPEIHNAMTAAWSPVSDDLALEEDLGAGRHALWIVASDGTRAHKLTEFAMATYGGLSWARDGKAIVYAALVAGHMQLFRIGTGGGEPRQLSHDDANLFEPAVSPDGRLIAATRLAHTKEVWRSPQPGRTSSGLPPPPPSWLGGSSARSSFRWRFSSRFFCRFSSFCRFSYP